MAHTDQFNLASYWEQIPNGFKHIVDLVSVTTLLGTLAEMLPHVAAIVTIIWTGIRIYETQTVQRWVGKDKPDD